MKTDYQVGIIGAGFAGLVAALRLKKSGRDSFVIFEKASEIGGTWRDNVYPGCACDVASPLYSFADEPNPRWSHLFSPQPEILRYMKDVVDKNDIRKHVRFNSHITEARFDEPLNHWRVTANGQTVTVQILLGALGPLNRVSKPTIPGEEQFTGKTYHSAEWDAGYDLTGKRVAVIGTGASSIQIVPAIAPLVAELTVFQRTAAWVMPRYDVAVSENAKKRLAKYPTLMKGRREFHFWINEFIGLGFIGNRLVYAFMKRVGLKKLAKEVHDPEIRQKLTPNYSVGCKRILKSDDYYPVFNRPNVHLVTDAIKEFTAEGIRTVDGAEHKLDVVIYATGFHTADLKIPIHIVGKNGASLIDVLVRSGGEVYKGSTVPGFPNFSLILGPNTGLGHNSVVHMMESQMNYIMAYIEQIEKLDGKAALDLKETTLKAYNEKIQGQFRGTVWASGCQSWYYNEQGKNTTLYPRLNSHFRKVTRRFDPEDYVAAGNITR